MPRPVSRRALIATAALFVTPVLPADAGRENRFDPFPGSPRALPLGLSASRDTNVFGWQYIPRQVRVAGLDVGVARHRFSSCTLRFGFFGMMELSGEDDDGRPFLGGGQNVDLWRAALGFSAALALDETARCWLGPRGRLEMVVSFRHESDHITGNEAGDTEPRFPTVPNIGDYVRPEVAIRVPLGPVDADFHLHHKVFVRRFDTGYTHGPGADAILRWPVVKKMHLFASTYGEYLFGGEYDQYGHRTRIPDAYFARQLAGIVLPARAGDFHLFASVRAGHGKGKLVYTEELVWGWGARLDLMGAFAGE